MYVCTYSIYAAYIYCLYAYNIYMYYTQHTYCIYVLCAALNYLLALRSFLLTVTYFE